MTLGNKNQVLGSSTSNNNQTKKQQIDDYSDDDFDNDPWDMDQKKPSKEPAPNTKSNPFEAK